MREITVREWFDIKKQRDRDIQEHFSKLTIRPCPNCPDGNMYSFDASWQKDPGMCASCRGDEGEVR